MGQGVKGAPRHEATHVIKHSIDSHVWGNCGRDQRSFDERRFALCDAAVSCSCSWSHWGDACHDARESLKRISPRRHGSHAHAHARSRED